ncbi:Competence-damage inducible protein CinA (plasmid) [Legionella adelaidensis]|uniref:RNA 2',3'-cyclic phosphodiesterase n=1 Tax=Legionella adelaidensis TaxID=45056 RepID=A0A0W0R6C1_9GAMM|nr:RNA 2',3'-cyclic phosphodiesterase [Legionella adelaidensis]KTC66573.1 Competence-damage inducible protein CinA [Legionella adelaidensis]VEH85483.1 Competence-damage inducible protein CinA [Legionella adelaidensis]
MRNVILKHAAHLGQMLTERRVRCAVAESCTGGGLGAAITAISGSSKWFDRGFITYSNEAKEALLGIPKSLIKKYGAVSKECAIAMVQGAIAKSDAEVAVSITGIAGPDGGTEEKPVGTVWIAWAGDTQKIVARCFLFKGDRESIRNQAIEKALEGLIKRCDPIKHPLIRSKDAGRYFIAIWPDKIEAEALIQHLLRTQCFPIEKLIPKENLHLTLAYLGKAYPGYLEDAGKVVQQIKEKPFTITLSEINHFKHQIVWCGLKKSSPALHNLFKRLTFNLITAGYIPENRPFIPHVTLARHMEYKEIDNFQSLNWTVKKICLAKSTGAPLYEIVKEWELG